MPTRLGDGVDDPLDPCVHGESEGEPDPTLGARGRERMGRTGRVRPGQQPRTLPLPGLVTGPGTSLLGQVGQGQVQHGDVVGGGVRPGVARPQQPGQCLPAGDVGTVQEAQQRMETIGLLLLCTSGIGHKGRGVIFRVGRGW